MGRCWTCGAPTGGARYFYICPACSEVEEIKTLNKTSIKSYDALKQLAVIQQEGFKDLSTRISDAASIIEWGLSELSWRVEQQTDVLRNIEQILNNPNQTKADEWRKIAEELRNRGDLPEAERFFTRALSTNPLDYRIYVGLAETYLKMEEFDKAKVYLEKSLIHAPKSSESDSDFDYRSYSYKLIGHIYMCKENYIEAANALQSAIQLSPYYYDGHYDYAQYCALVGDTQDCLMSLDFAIAGKPLFFNLAKSEQNFNCIKQHVQNYLSTINGQAYERANQALIILLKEHRQAEICMHSAQKAADEFNKLENRSTLKIDKTNEYEKIKSWIELVRSNMNAMDYSKLLEAESIGNKAIEYSVNLAKALDKLKDDYENSYNELKKKHSSAIRRGLLYFLYGVMGWALVMLLTLVTSRPLSQSGFISFVVGAVLTAIVVGFFGYFIGRYKDG